MPKKLYKTKKDSVDLLSKRSWFDFFSKLDMFGVKVALTYKGKHSFSTMPGIVISIILLALIGSFAFYQFYQLIFR